jgi:hypothetical protein
MEERDGREREMEERERVIEKSAEVRAAAE